MSKSQKSVSAFHSQRSGLKSFLVAGELSTKKYGAKMINTNIIINSTGKRIDSLDTKHGM